MKSRLAHALFLLMALLVLLPASANAAPVAGTIEFAEGDARIVGIQGAVRYAQANGTVFQGDSLVTGGSGEIHVRMADDGCIAVRPNTRMKIEAFRHEGDAEDKSSFELLKGAFRSITGWIGKYNPKNYSIRTPLATIGVRGTDHEPMHIPEPEPGEEAAAEPGTYDKVNEGESFIENQHGQVAVLPSRAAFVPLRERVAPRLLERVPAIFRAARNERLIEKRKEILRQFLEERSREIRERVKDRRAELQPQRGNSVRQLKEHREARRQEFAERHRQPLAERVGEKGESRQRSQQLHEQRKQAFEEGRGNQRKIRENRREEVGEGHPQRNARPHRRMD